MTTLKNQCLPIHWLGDSLGVLRSFPNGVRQDMGFGLYQIQTGQIPKKSRSMKSIGKGVYELKEADEKGWYRLVYFVKKKDRVVVLHCFEKNSRKTDRRDIHIAKIRYQSTVTQEKK